VAHSSASSALKAVAEALTIDDPSAAVRALAEPLPIEVGARPRVFMPPRNTVRPTVEKLATLDLQNVRLTAERGGERGCEGSPDTVQLVAVQ
jgi:hypothetical protein